jgi:phytoene dehydrogenase-like protein
VTNQVSNTLQIFNISNPAAPVLAGSVSTVNEPISVAVSGSFAYVVSIRPDTLQVFDISNPAAITLAREGWKILVVEAAPTIGGGTRTQELTLPGFWHDVCSAVHPTAVASPFFRSLNLEEHGLRWCHPEIPLAHPLDGGGAAVLHRSLDATAEGLGADRGRYRALFSRLVERAEDLYPAIFDPLSLPRHPFLMTRFGLPAALPAEWLAQGLFQTAEARALFAGNAAHCVLPLNHLFTSAIGVLLQLSAHAVGWPVAEGGSRSINRALAAVLTQLGGEIACDWPVKTLTELPPASEIADVYTAESEARRVVAGFIG